MNTVGLDLRFSLRALSKSPGFTAAAVIILALGIGANTAIFSLVDAVLLRPLPFPEPEQLMRLQEASTGPVRKALGVSPARYLDWRAGSHAFTAMAAYHGTSLTLTGGQEPESLVAATVSGDLFAVFAIRPLLGRVFAPGEEEQGHDDVVILSQALWQGRFGADPRVLGREILLDGRRHTVVGVMPALRVAAWYPAVVQVWKPLAWTPRERAARNERSLSVIARLKPGVDRRRAQAELDVLSGRLARQYPETDKGWGAAVEPIHDYLVKAVRPAFLLLLEPSPSSSSSPAPTCPTWSSCEPWAGARRWPSAARWGRAAGGWCSSSWRRRCSSPWPAASWASTWRTSSRRSFAAS